MARPPTKFLIAGAVLIAAAGYLVAAGVRAGAVYYIDVDTFIASPARHSERARLHGVVSEGLESRPAELRARFQLAGARTHVAVEYHGPVSDQLREGRQVVVEGRLDSHGVFQADTLLTRCASKYEAAARGVEERP